MTENDKVVYKQAINDARELLLDEAEKKINDSLPSEALAITRCSELLCKMKDRL